MIFRFECAEDLNKVLSAGPFERPLLLKVMPPFFQFGYEEQCKVPVWVKLRNLPLELWNARALSKILSRVGTPIRSDHITASMAAISYARALVEVDVSQRLVEQVSLRLPNGRILVQPIEFEKVPAYCSHCQMVGHSTSKCKAAPELRQDPSKNTETEDHPEASSAINPEGDGKYPEIGKSSDHLGKTKVPSQPVESHHKIPNKGQWKKTVPNSSKLTSSEPPKSGEDLEDGFTPVKVRNRRKSQKKQEQSYKMSSNLNQPVPGDVSSLQKNVCVGDPLPRPTL